MENNIERILNGNKEALVSELCKIATWARDLSAEDWECITSDTDGGLTGVIRRIVDSNLIEDALTAIFNKAYEAWEDEMKATGFREGEKLASKAQRLFDEAYERGDIGMKVTASRLDTPCGRLIVRLEYEGGGADCELEYKCSKKDCPHADACASGDAPDGCLVARVKKMV